MCAARGPLRAPYKGQESAPEAKQTALQRARRPKSNTGFQPPHRPLLPTSTERELRPRRAPVNYYESDDDERTPRRPVPRARRAAADRRYQATHRAQRSECQKRYRAKHRERILETDRRYREQHRERIREKDRQYFKAHQEQIQARQRRYREAHREEVRERQRRYRERCREELKEKKRRYRESHREEVKEKLQRYRESHREELREQQRRYREAHPERVREQNRIRQTRYRKAHPERVREQNRIRRARYQEKKRMAKLMTLTIPLTDCRTSMPVADYVQTFCDSLDSVDTPESFLQLLLEECPTGLDSGTIQGSEPSDCHDLSFLQDLLSPDEWEQVMDDVQDFDVQDFNIEAFAEDWWEDMTSSDEGIDLLYDLVS